MTTKQATALSQFGAKIRFKNAACARLVHARFWPEIRK